MKNIISTLALTLFLMSCASTQAPKPKPAPPSKVTVNFEHIDAELKGEITQEQRRATFTRERAECSMESNKVPLAAPSCSAPAKYSCQGLGGFNFGQCIAQNTQSNQNCDYTAYNASRQAQINVLVSCMVSKGYSEMTDEEYAEYRAARKAELGVGE
jgi:hypothetical protein